jgi:hypothetical protein
MSRVSEDPWSTLSEPLSLVNAVYFLTLCFFKTYFKTFKTNVRGLFFSISDRASKEARNAREPDLRVA